MTFINGLSSCLLLLRNCCWWIVFSPIMRNWQNRNIAPQIYLTSHHTKNYTKNLHSREYEIVTCHMWCREGLPVQGRKRLLHIFLFDVLRWICGAAVVVSFLILYKRQEKELHLLRTDTFLGVLYTPFIRRKVLQFKCSLEEKALARGKCIAFQCRTRYSHAIHS